MNAPALMTGQQIESYAAWLIRIAGRCPGALADKLRAAAKALLNSWSESYGT